MPRYLPSEPRRATSTAAVEVQRASATEATALRDAQPAIAARLLPRSGPADARFARASGATRVRPAVRLQLACVLLAAARITAVVQRSSLEGIDLPTVRIDLPLAHEQQHFVQELPRGNMTSGTTLGA